MKDKRNSLIEEIIEKQQVPDMVYAPVKKRPRSKSEERIATDVPEFVLPKTRAEVVEEAEQRLKTVDNRQLVKLARERNEVIKRNSNEMTGIDVKTVVMPSFDLDKTSTKEDKKDETHTFDEKKSNERKSDDRKSDERSTVTVDLQTRLKERNNLKRVKTDKFVGKPEDIMPFAWRYPLKNERIKKTSKFFREMLMEENERSKFLPINAEENKSD